jgi:hypothetical protein
VMGVRVRGGRQPMHECQHRDSGSKTAQHDGSIVNGPYHPCQAIMAGASRYCIMRP